MDGKVEHVEAHNPEVKHVTVLKQDGSQVTTAVADLPEASKLAEEMKAMQGALGIQVNGKVIKKEQ